MLSFTLSGIGSWLTFVKFMDANKEYESPVPVAWERSSRDLIVWKSIACIHHPKNATADRQRGEAKMTRKRKKTQN